MCLFSDYWSTSCHVFLTLGPLPDISGPDLLPTKWRWHCRASGVAVKIKGGTVPYQTGNDTHSRSSGDEAIFWREEGIGKDTAVVHFLIIIIENSPTLGFKTTTTQNWGDKWTEALWMQGSRNGAQMPEQGFLGVQSTSDHCSSWGHADWTMEWRHAGWAPAWSLSHAFSSFGVRCWWSHRRLHLPNVLYIRVLRRSPHSFLAITLELILHLF